MVLSLMRSNWWRKTLPIRVVLYLGLLALILYARMNRNTSANSAPEELPTVAVKTQQQAGEKEETRSISEVAPELYPKITFYSWALQEMPGAPQEVWVLLRPQNNLQHLAWDELKLRGPAGLDADLASGTAAGKPESGALTKLVFKLPQGQAPFAAGRLYLWIKDLPDAALTPQNRITPAQLDQALIDLAKETAAAKTGS